MARSKNESSTKSKEKSNTNPAPEGKDQLILSLDDEIEDPFGTSLDRDTASEDQIKKNVSTESTVPPITNTNSSTKSGLRSIKSKDPIRRSGRKRSQSVPTKICIRLKKPTRRVQWNKIEKTQLLDGLQRVGERDISNLSKYVPTKTPSQINYYISVLKARVPAYLKNRRTEQPENWVEHFRQLTHKLNRINYDPLPLSFLLISLFENMPTNNLPGEIDFKSLYEYLFCEMAEVTRPNLNMKTKYFLYKSLVDIENDIMHIKKNVFEEVRNSSTPKEWPFSSKAMNPLTFPKVEIEFNKK